MHVIKDIPVKSAVSEQDTGILLEKMSKLRVCAHTGLIYPWLPTWAEQLAVLHRYEQQKVCTAVLYFIVRHGQISLIDVKNGTSLEDCLWVDALRYYVTIMRRRHSMTSIAAGDRFIDMTPDIRRLRLNAKFQSDIDIVVDNDMTLSLENLMMDSCTFDAFLWLVKEHLSMSLIRYEIEAVTCEACY